MNKGYCWEREKDRTTRKTEDARGQIDLSRALVSTVMKCREIPDYMRNWRLLKKGSAPWSEPVMGLTPWDT
jgi:hypothetical protein